MAEITPVTREQLAELLRGRGDEDILPVVEAMGPEAVLEQVFGEMPRYFRRDRAGAASAVVQWEVITPDGTTHTYQLKVEGGTCTCVRGTREEPRVTFRLALPDFLRLIAGVTDGMQAFMSGKLKLSGDLMFAASVQTWFAPAA